MNKQELQDKLQDDALTAVGNDSRVGIDVVTGGGKTLLGLKHMASQYTESSMFLVVAPKKSIFDDWKAEAIEHGYEFLLSRITFTTYRSLASQEFNEDWAYLDECHSLKYSHQDWLDMHLLHGGKILGLSGTFPTRGEKGNMCEKYCRKVFTVNLDEAIGSGMLNNYRIYVHMLEMSDKRNFKQTSSTGKEWWTSELKDYNFWTNLLEEEEDWQVKNRLRITRMKKVQAYPTKTEYVKHLLKKIDCKTLIFATSKTQAEELSAHHVHSGHSDKENRHTLDLFNKGLIYRVAAIDQIAEGKNIKGLEMGIIMHAYANDTKTRQKIGRFLRLSPEQTATIHILCYENSIDLQWVQGALKKFDPTKIKIIRPKFKTAA